MKEYHILNGDVLKSQLEKLEGEKIVLRECLVEGETKGDNLKEVFKTRTLFFKEVYGISEEECKEKTIDEISRITRIEQDAVINLWFENDLFCQANCWFAVNVLQEYQLSGQVYLVSPITDSWKGFGGLDYERLVESYHARKRLSEEDQKGIQRLWRAFQQSNWNDLRENARMLHSRIDQIEAVVEAHIARFPKEGGQGRPQESILKIVEELDDPDFGKIFQAFCEREGIYGFGDLQVKRIVEEMNIL